MKMDLPFQFEYNYKIHEDSHKYWANMTDYGQYTFLEETRAQQCDV